MNDAELRALFPVHIMRGALLRSDHGAVGIVVGGAPSWELLAYEARETIGSAYHRLLLALNSTLDIYLVDKPVDLAGEIAELQMRRSRFQHPLLSNALDELTGYLMELQRSSNNQSKQVVWTITVENGMRAPHMIGAAHLSKVIGAKQPQPKPKSQIALREAVDQASQLVEALRALDTGLTPRLMEAEEIAQLWYQLADPVRAARYPLTGTLLDRVRRLITIE